MWLFWQREWGSAFNAKCINFTFILLSRVLNARFRSGVFSEGETACHWEGKAHWEPKSGCHTRGKDTKCCSTGMCGGVAGAKALVGELYAWEGWWMKARDYSLSRRVWEKFKQDRTGYMLNEECLGINAIQEPTVRVNLRETTSYCLSSVLIRYLLTDYH